jgi:hypothetical protein
MKDEYKFAGVALTALIIAIVAVTFLMLSGCIIRNENIIQYGSSDSLDQKEQAEGSLQATVEGPLKPL